MKPGHVLLIVGCVLAVFVLAGLVSGIVWLARSPEGGVRAANDMETYVAEYLADHDVLEDDEELLAYYDVTLALDSTEAAIVTDRRVIYHKNGRNTAIALADVEDVRHREEPLVGHVFEIASASGRVMKIEIAPLNGGDTFKNVLMRAVQNV